MIKILGIKTGVMLDAVMWGVLIQHVGEV